MGVGFIESVLDVWNLPKGLDKSIFQIAILIVEFSQSYLSRLNGIDQCCYEQRRDNSPFNQKTLVI